MASASGIRESYPEPVAPASCRLEAGAPSTETFGKQLRLTGQQASPPQRMTDALSIPGRAEIHNGGIHMAGVRRLSTFILLLTLAASLQAQDLASAEKRTTVRKPANGLTAIVMERPEAPVFSFATVVNTS